MEVNIFFGPDVSILDKWCRIPAPFHLDRSSLGSDKLPATHYSLIDQSYWYIGCIAITIFSLYIP